MKNHSDTPPETQAAEKRLRIRTLNDTFRATFIGGRILLTQGIQAMEESAAQELIHKVQTYKNFTTDNDPHGEHDFGSLEYDGQKVFWKIDTYDENLEFGSEEPWNTEKTTRVLTVMLAEEY